MDEGSVRRAGAGAGGSVRVAPLVAAIVAAVLLAIPEFLQARVDWQYQLVGLADPFLGRPAPAWTLGWLAAAATVYLVVVLAVRWWLRPVRLSLAIPCIVPLGAAGGYLIGTLATLAAGGPIDHPGTVRLELGPPFATAVELPATCTTAPGKPDVPTVVVGDGDGVPAIHLANLATGAPLTVPGGIALDTVPWPRTGRPPAVVVPRMPERPTMHGVGTGVDSLFLEPATPFFGAYIYLPHGGTTIGTWTGSVELEAERAWRPGFVIDQLVPNDPWPAAYPLTMSWTCDPAAIRPAPVPVPAPAQERWTPTPPPTASPIPTAAVPVEVRLVTSSEWATVRIAGATVAAAGEPRVEGAAAASYEGGVLRVEPVPPVARARAPGWRCRSRGSSLGRPSPWRSTTVRRGPPR